jgi:hypothetical protein
VATKLLLAVALFLILAATAGCDPNEPDTFGVRFENDLAQPVLLALCHSDHSAKCEHPFYRDLIARNEVTEENISPGVQTEWAVESGSGHLVRCVLLYWGHYPGATQRVRLSDAPRWSRPCARTTSAYG